MAKLDNQAWRILVVDDEPLVSRAIQMSLPSGGHKVVTADGGNTALTLLDQGHFDLIMVDFLMAEMNGDELAATIKERFSYVPVVMTTAHVESLRLSDDKIKDVDFLIGKLFIGKNCGRQSVSPCRRFRALRGPAKIRG